MSVNDPLLTFRNEFPILDRTNYLVSNSLGAMPRGVPDRLADYADAWATYGVRAWAREWWSMPGAVGDMIAPLIGAGPGEVVLVPNVTLAQATILGTAAPAADWRRPGAHAHAGWRNARRRCGSHGRPVA